MESLCEGNIKDESVIYRIYTKSFFDSDGDGIGDVKGVTSKLSHFSSLGIGALALSDILETDSDDFLFGVTDYKRVNPALGTLSDIEELIQSAHSLGIDFYLSFPLGFTSTAHTWFEKSRAGVDLNPYREYYIWQKGKGKSAPSADRTPFKTPIWSYDEKSREWYRSYFGNKYPELNFDNPRVRKEIIDVLRFWIDKGVDGFIFENVYFATDKPLLAEETLLYKAGEDIFTEGRGTYRMLREIKEKCPADIHVILAPQNVSSDIYPYLISGDKPVADKLIDTSLILDTEVIAKRAFSIKEFAERYLRMHSSACAPDILIAFDDKAHSRLLSKFVTPDDDRFVPAGKMLSALLLCAVATPTLYQGQEIGMTDFTSFKANEHKNYTAAPELLHARSPFQWDNNRNAAFTANAYSEIPVNGNYHKINLLAESADSDSIFSFYRRMLSFRASSPALQRGSFRNYSDDTLLCFLRETETERLLFIANPTPKPLNAKPPKEFLGVSALCEICNYGVVSKTLNETMGLRPYEVRIFRLRPTPLALN